MYYFPNLQPMVYLLPQNPVQIEEISQYFMFPVCDSTFNMGSNMNLNFQD